jgi:hypothetical protein
VEIPGVTQGDFDRFLAFTSLNWNALATRLRSEHALDESFAYRYSSLREFPLVQISHHGQDEIACPIPTLLFWRITSGLYYSLKDTPGFPTAFGASFQQYVGQVLRKRITNPEMTVLGEEQYHRGRQRRDSVDWIVQQDVESALFVECKTKRLTWASKAGLSDLSALEQDIRKLAGAVLQIYKTIADYRIGLYPHLAYSARRCIYPAVVTLEDWYLFGVDMPARLDDEVRRIMETVGLPAVWLDEMPYSILSVDEFEKASGVINTVGIRPAIEGKAQHPEFRRWGFEAYCNDQYKNEVRNLPDLFRDEYETMFANQMALFQTGP